MKNRLLDNISYGNELNDLDNGCASLRRIHQDEMTDGTRGGWDHVVALTRRFFEYRGAGIFGGPITAGDALFIASFMARERPEYMYEIGVASGFSSAFILHAASELELLKDGVFLYSYDLSSELPDGNKVGQYVLRHFGQFGKHWSLTTGKTTIDLLEEGSEAWPRQGGGGLAFIDGGHRHPWPMADVYCMSKILSEGSWVLMQDYQMMERWYADSIEFGLPVNGPVRGVNLAVALWKGEKQIGTGLAYNMAGLRLGDIEASAAYAKRINAYEFEGPFPQTESLST